MPPNLQHIKRESLTRMSQKLMEEAIEWRLIKNDGSEEVLVLLNAVKNVIAQQLPQISRLTITKNIFDIKYESLVLFQKGDDELLGGATCRFIEQLKVCFLEYFAVAKSKMRQGFGRKLLNFLKKVCIERQFMEITAHADVYSIDFYLKNGFVEISKKQAKQWSQLFPDYLHTKPLSYKLSPKMKDIDPSRQRVKRQFDLLKESLSRIEYRQFSYSAPEIERMLQREERNKKQASFKKNKTIKVGIFQDDSKSIYEKQVMRAKILIRRLKKNKFCWVIQSPLLGKVFNEKFGILNIDEIMDLVDQGPSLDIQNRVCCELLKTFEVLAQELPTESPFAAALRQMAKFSNPIIQSLIHGTFNLTEELQILNV